MNFLDRFAYVRELKDQLVRHRLEIIDLKADVKKLVDTLCTTRQILAPFASRSAPEDWGTVRRVSIAREIQELEAKHDTRKDDEQ